MSRKKIVSSFIYYQERKNGCRYAKFCPSDRNHGGKDAYLGVVIDEEQGIFYNRNRGGYFGFTIEKGYFELSAGEIEYLDLMKRRLKNSKTDKTLIIDFGNAWFLDQILVKSGLKELCEQILPEESDTLLSLIAYKLLDSDANYYAERWWEGSYAKYLYPKAVLTSQRISEFMERLGKEEVKRVFFDKYLTYLKRIPGLTDNVLFDSTGLPNDIQFGYSAINNHNGVISREVRLIYVVERTTGLPVYFRFVAGNVVDVSTLKVTINQLKANGIEVHHGILDAGYWSKGNIGKLFGLGIAFLIRLPDKSLAKDLIKKHGSDVLSVKNTIAYGTRTICVKRVKEKIEEHDCYAYISIDVDRQKDEQVNYLKKSTTKNKKKTMSDDKLATMGFFVLISSEKLDPDEVLPYYYMRQSIEQTFDYAKNDVDLLPLRTHKEETFRGHLLISFISTVVLITVKQILASRKSLKNLCPKSTLKDFRFVKSTVYPHLLVTSEASKYVNEVLRELKLDIPETINL